MAQPNSNESNNLEPLSAQEPVESNVSQPLLSAQEPSKSDAYELLRHWLTGNNIPRPRFKNACSMWKSTCINDIEAGARRVMLDKLLPGKKLGTVRDQVARTMFERLPPETKGQWEKLAKEEHEKALERWKNEVEGPLSTDPADRQQCIEKIGRLMQPILDHLCEGTGFCATLICGGPEPSTKSYLCALRNDVRRRKNELRSFRTRSIRAALSPRISKLFANQLQSVQAPIVVFLLLMLRTGPQECHSRALPTRNTFKPMESSVMEGEININTIDLPKNIMPLYPAPPATASTPIPSTETPSLISHPDGSVFHLEDTHAASNAPLISPPPNFPSLLEAPWETSPLSTPSLARSPPPPLPVLVESSETSFATPVIHASAASPRVVTPANACEGNSFVSAVPPQDEVSVSLRHQSSFKDSNTSGDPFGDTVALGSTFLGNSSAFGLDGAGVRSHSTFESHELKEGEGEPSTGQDKQLFKRPLEDTDSMSNSSAKRARRSTSMPTDLDSKHVEPPPDAPAWLPPALSMLQQNDLGDEWVSLVGAWLAFEVQSKYEHVANLSAIHRPPAVRDWIQRARLPAWRPNIPNINKYAAKFWMWWAVLQPRWRVNEDGEVVTSAVDGDWEQLRRPGVNGLLSVLASLFFWGVAVKGKREATEKWLVAVQDVRLTVDKTNLDSPSAQEPGERNAYQLLRHRLTGESIPRPRLKNACTLWRKTRRDDIAAAARRTLAGEGIPAKKLVAARDQVARAMFERLPQDTKAWWEKMAKEEHEKELEKWKKEVEGPLSEVPEDRQLCIEHIVELMQPILDLMCEGTGFCATLMCGGPEPANGGRLKVIGYDVPFVQMSGTKDCHSRALPSGYTFSAEEGINVDTIDFLEDIIPQYIITPAVASSGAPSAKNPAFVPGIDIPTSAFDNIGSVQKLPFNESGMYSLPNLSWAMSPMSSLTPSPSRSLSPPPLSPSLKFSESHFAMPSVHASAASFRIIAPPPDACEGRSFLTTAAMVRPRDEAPTTLGPESAVEILKVTTDEFGDGVPLGLTSFRNGSDPAVEDDFKTSNVELPVGAYEEDLSVSAIPPHHEVSAAGPQSVSEKANEISDTSRDEIALGALPSSRGTDPMPASDNSEISNVASKSRVRDGGGVSVTSSHEKTSKRPLEDADLISASSAKRARTPPSTPTEPNSKHIEPPPDAPAWLPPALSMLQQGSLGDEWASLVHAWLTFEVKSHYEPVADLSTTHRPPAVRDWIQRARAPAWRPNIPNVNKYAAKFWLWWAALQPRWRPGMDEDGELVTSAVEGDWEPLRRPGVNGLLSVLAALFFWGVVVKGKRAGRDKWLLAVQDVKLAIEKVGEAVPQVASP
ncbi:unnamed protein product [Cyclocybe aegerita]|uniref:Uncharacterized protein n=1 Tax=Cyclocybe aegerita TaxID=1973307 RepID=A0A8S0WYJ5_CYCAE|nr:unnamed protein product [Cyclocybe aegerita]